MPHAAPTTHTFIGGDFNAHHEALWSKTRNRSGHHIAEAMANVPEAKLLNSGEAVHNAGGILDLSFVSQTIVQEAKWEIHPHLASDHYAICIILNIPQLAKSIHTPK